MNIMDDLIIYRRVINYLKDFITQDRLLRINKVLEFRTNHLTIVLEDLHKVYNANAVLRSCDGFGIQDVHIIENRNEFDSAESVSIGAHNWLSLYRYNDKSKNIDTCFDHLRSKGYQIIATTPHERGFKISKLDVTQKTALVFGGELEGVSNEVIKKADKFVTIPMFGFSESFNISVSAAICMYEITKKIRSRNFNWTLSNSYKTLLRYQWIKKTIKAGDQLEAKFLEKNKLKLSGNLN